MVAIKVTGSRKPLFCIHGRAEALVKYIDEEQPFYWLHHRQDGRSNYDLSIEEVAKLHLNNIKTVQAEGPYHLAGFSIGGMLACEIAHQLEQAGEEVASLSLLDPTPPYKATIKKSWTQKLSCPDGEIMPVFIAEKFFRVLLGRWNKLKFKLKMSIEHTKIKFYESHAIPLPPDIKIRHWLQEFAKTARHYRYPVCHCKIVFFTPEGHPHQLAERLSSIRLSWQSIAAGGLDIRVISGCVRHKQILEEPYVRDLVEQMNAIHDDIHQK